MKEPRCIAQLLRNQQNLTPINFTITHGRGRKGIIIRTCKPSVIGTAITFMKTRRLWKWL
jgi:hypothetical protein